MTFRVCDVNVSGHCEMRKTNIWLNDEEVSVCANCLEHVAMNGHVEDGELYYDHDN